MKRTHLVSTSAAAVAALAIPVGLGLTGPDASAHAARPEAHRAATVADTPRTTATTTVTPTAGPTASPTAADGPPVLRVQDMLSVYTQRKLDLFDAYATCLLDHGADTVAPSRMSTVLDHSSAYDANVAWPPPAAARTACADLDPALPPALDAATNPTFHTQAAAYVACLADHGERVRLLDDHDLDWTYRPGSTIPDDQGAMEDACLLGAFGSG